MASTRAGPAILPSSASTLVDRTTMGGGNTWQESAFKILLLAAQTGAIVYFSYYTVHTLTQLGKGQEAVNVNALKRQLAKRLRRPEIEVMDINSYEARVSVDCIAPEDIDVSFADIGGMEEQLETVRDNIILPMQMASMKGYKTALACPTGALLFGRPGTGKTMTAKALAKEAKATFLNIKASTLMEKYLGESDKMALAVFSLARKLSPTVIFIDEIDTLLRNRASGSDNTGCYNSMQGVLLAEWDGLVGMDKPVVVLGATNRPQDLDKAFLRRMPVMIKVEVPDLRGRLDILRRMLAEDVLDSDVVLEEVATDTRGFTGSDLRELVRVARLQRAKQLLEAMKAEAAGGSGGMAAAEGAGKSIRSMVMADFIYAMGKSRTTGSVADDYASELLYENAKDKQSIWENAKKLVTKGADDAASEGVME